jgi:glycosyltransferase involved in cell wall biosynthesis
MKVAIISYMFPPMGGGGIQRILSLANHLTNSCDVTVVTEDVSRYAYDVYDNSVFVDSKISVLTPSGVTNPSERLVQEFSLKSSESVSVKRHGRGLKKILKNWINWFLPDSKISFVVGVMRNLLISDKHDIVVASVRPPSNAVVGFIYSVLKNVPLIVEYRDLWFGQEFQTKMYSPFLYMYEYLVLNRAVKIIVVSPAYEKILVSRYPWFKDKFELLTNGFDVNLLERSPNNQNLARHFSHYGRFYGPRKPDQFTDILSKLESNLFLDHYGPYYHSHSPLFRNKGHISYSDAWRSQNSSMSGILLVIEYTADNIPGKLFEYYATGKPVLCVVPFNSVIREVFAGVERFVFTDHSEVSISQSIRIVLEKDELVQVLKTDRFSRDVINGHYESILREYA